MIKDYRDALQWMLEHLPMYQRIGAPAFKKDLHNIRRLSEFLGQPHLQYPVIHLAGTNGKGTTSHMVAAVLQAAGLKVGLHTSPHYKEIGERAKINGRLISKREILHFINRVLEVSETIKPSYFEISVAMAFDHFARHKVDVAVIETGLGGRLDSTNIVNPILSVITGIHYDHMAMLGDTLEAIASEKAGIIKSHTPVVIGPQYNAVVMPVFYHKAQSVNSDVYPVEPRLSGNIETWDEKGTWFNVDDSENEWSGRWFVQAHGPFQIRNLLTTLQSISVLASRFNLTNQNVIDGLAHLRELTYYIGRWQWLSQHPRILADSAHNEEGYAWMVPALRSMSWRRLHMVIGVVKDKDIRTMLTLLPKEAIYYFCQANIPRALPVDELKSQAQSAGLRGQTFSTVKKALAAAKRAASEDDLIFVGGSTFVVAEVL